MLNAFNKWKFCPSSSASLRRLSLMNIRKVLNFLTATVANFTSCIHNFIIFTVFYWCILRKKKIKNNFYFIYTNLWQHECCTNQYYNELFQLQTNYLNVWPENCMILACLDTAETTQFINFFSLARNLFIEWNSISVYSPNRDLLYVKTVRRAFDSLSLVMEE